MTQMEASLAMWVHDLIAPVLKPLVFEAVRTALKHETSAPPLAQRSVPLEWMTTGDVVNQFGISKSTLSRLRQSGQINAYKKGSKIFYRRSDIITWIESSLD